MTARSRQYLKDKFEAGDTPPQQDFQDLIDSFLLVTDDFLTYEDAQSGSGTANGSAKRASGIVTYAGTAVTAT